MRILRLAVFLIVAATSLLAQDSTVIYGPGLHNLDTNPLDTASTHQPFEYGVVFQGGNGLTGGVFGEASHPMLRTSRLQAVSVLRPRTDDGDEKNEQKEHGA